MNHERKAEPEPEDNFESTLAGITYTASEEQTSDDENATDNTNEGTTTCPVCQATVEAGASKCGVCAFEFQ